MNKLKEFFSKESVPKILDVGTGTGDFIKVLKETFNETEIVGVDPNNESLKEATEKYPEYNFREMNGENLDFPESSFDLVSISMALHHLPDINRTLYEMQRVLKPNGWILISELFSDNLNNAQEVHKFFHHFRSATDRVLGISHNKTFKRKEILEVVKNSGIDIKLSFDFIHQQNVILTADEVEARVEKMKEMLERIKSLPEYDSFLPQIDEFRKRALKYGFQPATRLVIVGSKT